MLNQSDKKWIIETIDDRLDEKLEATKAELRDEMWKMEKNITERVTEDVTRDIMTVFENTYGEYIKLIAELVPDKAMV